MSFPLQEKLAKKSFLHDFLHVKKSLVRFRLKLQAVIYRKNVFKEESTEKK